MAPGHREHYPDDRDPDAEHVSGEISRAGSAGTSVFMVYYIYEPGSKKEKRNIGESIQFPDHMRAAGRNVLYRVD